MNYDDLLEHAKIEGLQVKELPLQSADGRIRGDRIAIREDIETTTEKACKLAEELGHHHTTVGNIIGENGKQERQARFWAYEHQIGLEGLIRAFDARCQNTYEAADFLGVTEEFLIDAIYAYKGKYGPYVRIGQHTIIFEPTLYVIERIERR